MTTRSCARVFATLLSAEPDVELVAEASHGEKAIKRFRSHRTDVALMDLQMPGLNGIDAINLIQSAIFDDPCILGSLKMRGFTIS
jgi:DNA-binding NarL/FixJ family response regulator